MAKVTTNLPPVEFVLTLTEDEALYVAAHLGRGYPERTARALNMSNEYAFANIYPALCDAIDRRGLERRQNELSKAIRELP